MMADVQTQFLRKFGNKLAPSHDESMDKFPTVGFQYIIIFNYLFLNYFQDSFKTSKCSTCLKSFSSAYNLNRHRKLVHGYSKTQINKGQQNKIQTHDRDDVSDTSDIPKKKQRVGGANIKKENMETNWEYWSTIVSETLNQMEKLPDNNKNLLQEPFVGEFLWKLWENIMQKIQFVEYMENEDEVYEKIKNTAKIFISKQQIDKAEAYDKAWEDRKFLVLRFLNNHIDKINSLMLLKLVNNMIDKSKKLQDNNDDEENEEVENDDDDDESENEDDVEDEGPDEVNTEDDDEDEEVEEEEEENEDEPKTRFVLRHGINS